MTENKKKSGPIRDLLPLIIGEVIVVGLVIGGYTAVDLCGIYDTDYGKVVLGAMLGAAVILINHLCLSLSVDREIKKYLEVRGSSEMSEEEAESFTKQHSTRIQKAMALSTVIRTVSMFGVLILAFLTGWFNPLATAIPIFALRFILYATELIKSKSNPKPDPTKFIKYEWDDDKNKEKEEE